MDTGQQWAEVCFVPIESARKKDGPKYRFLAIREPLAQLELEGMESDQAALPFPVIDYQGQIILVVSNFSVWSQTWIWSARR